jgi:hypothetical protein
MYLTSLQSDQFYTWSDKFTKRACGRPAKTPQSFSAPIAAAPGHPARLPYRALQTMREAWMQMCRRPWPWPQVLSVGELPGLASANGLCATGVLRANSGVPGQLSPSPRDLGDSLRDQPRTAAPSRGALKSRHERITSCLPRSARCGIRRCAPRQYAGRLARQRSKDFVPCVGNS